MSDPPAPLIKRALVFINGIFTPVGRKDAWNDRAVIWMNERFPEVKAIAFEYFSDAIFRSLYQRKRAMQLAGVINRELREGYSVTVVAHSNGAAVLSYLISEMGMWINNAHLISPASRQKDYELALQEKNVQYIYLYGSKNDWALKYGATTSRIITVGFGGYGSLGREGKEFEAAYPGRVFDFSDHAQDHSSWFEGEQFDRTMNLVMVNEGILRVGQQTPHE